MRPISRLTLVTPLLACFVMAAVASPATAFEPEERKCRAAVARSGTKLTKTILRIFTSCHKSRNRNGDVLALNCNDIGSADADNEIYRSGGARSKFDGSVNAKCASSAPTSPILFEECPAPCGDELTPITAISTLRDCLLCLAVHQTETYSEEANGLPTLPLASAEEAACHASITKSSSKLFSTVLRGVTKCQSRVDNKIPGDTTTCTVDEFSAITSRGFDRCVNAVNEDCAAVTLPSATLDACGGASTTAELETCVCESARQRAGELAAFFVSLEATETTTTTTSTTTYTTTSTTLLAGAADCPDIGEIVLYSRDSKTSCTTNADCTAPRTCDAGSGLCTTVSDLDLGWAGLAHDQDLNDGIRTRTRLHCPGPGPVCGECNVVGVDPEPRNCRCANDSRTICDQPFAAHTDVCGGAACHCYSGPPTPVSAGGTPVCLVNRFAGNLTGTVNVDTGAGSTSVRLLTRAHLGLATSVPCPVCAGKCSDDESACTVDADCGVGPTCVFDTPDDGIRGGLCVGGESPGESCDAMGTNSSYPAQFGGGGGGQHSLDCMPFNNISGTGLRIAFEETTGLVSLGSNVDCDGSGAGTELCPCKVCSKDRTAACDGDADCASQGSHCSGSNSPNPVGCDTNPDCASADVGTCTVAGNTRCSLAFNVVCNGNDALCQDVNLGTCVPSSCSSDGNGTPPNPNSCDSGTCTDLGGGNGECTTGPDDSFCDGMTTAAGAGILLCSTNSDCTPGVVGGDAGNCSLITRRRCFPDPIIATGSPDAVHPVTVAAFCMAPTNNAAVNVTFGLPGPGRQVSQQATRSLCASDHGTVYVPGAGGCP